MSKKNNNGKGKIIYPCGSNGVALPHFFDGFDKPITNQRLFWAAITPDGKPFTCLAPLSHSDHADALAFAGRKARNRFIATYVQDWPNMNEDDKAWYDAKMWEHIQATCKAVYRA